ncbi:MAG: DUF3179 domain-containing (seleno)protein [Bacteroidia bacterium]
MKSFFYAGLIGIILIEFLKVYFIMPMPGSQEINSIDVAYFLYSYRWAYRVVFILMAVAGSVSVFKVKYKIIPTIFLLFAAVVTWLFNFKMTADKMFLQPENVVLKAKPENKIPVNHIIIGIENNGEAKAYPVGFLAYHHQVLDTIGGKPVMVTYCSVCRTGRVFEPIVNGHYEKFRLVGMDHFNAMFEDATTKSWWRQSTGIAVTGKMKGSILPAVHSRQMALDKWFELYPQSLVMQPDEASIVNYDSLARFEQGKSKSSLTRTDSLSWKEKSWVVGVWSGNNYKCYDWNYLKKVRIINDTIGTQPIVLVLSTDGKSFAAFEKPSIDDFTISHDTIYTYMAAYDFAGNTLYSNLKPLKAITAYQEFWHSWRTFHTDTRVYTEK